MSIPQQSFNVEEDLACVELQSSRSFRRSLPGNEAELRTDSAIYKDLKHIVNDSYKGKIEVDTEHDVSSYKAQHMQKNETFDNMIIVAGHPSRCVAMSCDDYARWYWGVWGSVFLEAMNNLFLHNRADEDVFAKMSEFVYTSCGRTIDSAYRKAATWHILHPLEPQSLKMDTSITVSPGD